MCLGQPDNYLKEEHCGMVRMFESYNDMNDYDCRGKRRYICQPMSSNIKSSQSYFTHNDDLALTKPLRSCFHRVSQVKGLINNARTHYLLMITKGIACSFRNPSHEMMKMKMLLIV